jgi:hypothetical protein
MSMTLADKTLQVTYAARALTNQANTILDGYLGALDNRDAYHRNLAARQPEKSEKIVVLVYGGGGGGSVSKPSQRAGFSLNWPSIFPWLACTAFWVALGSVIVEMI